MYAAGRPARHAHFRTAYMLSLRFPISDEQSVHLFCAVLGTSFLHALARPARCALIEQLSIAGTACLLAALMPIAGSAVPLWAALRHGDAMLAGVNIGLLLWAVALLWAAWLVFRPRSGASNQAGKRQLGAPPVPAE